MPVFMCIHRHIPAVKHVYFCLEFWVLKTDYDDSLDTYRWLIYCDQFLKQNSTSTRCAYDNILDLHSFTIYRRCTSRLYWIKTINVRHTTSSSSSSFSVQPQSKQYLTVVYRSEQRIASTTATENRKEAESVFTLKFEHGLAVKASVDLDGECQQSLHSSNTGTNTRKMILCSSSSSSSVEWSSVVNNHYYHYCFVKHPSKIKLQKDGLAKTRIFRETVSIRTANSRRQI